MEQRRNKRKIQRKKRMIRRLIKFLCRCMVLGFLTVVLIIVVKAYKSIVIPSSVYKSIAIPTSDYLEEEGYPESLITLLEKNPETKEFVLNYHKNKDKYFEMDLSDEVTKGTIPLFLQWDERWGYENYGGDFLAVTGCGPTCLSMVWCGLSGDMEWNPLEVANMAEKQGYYVEGVGSSWSLMTEGADLLGLISDEVIFDAEHIVERLQTGSPIICVMRPGDFTTTGHFIVLSGVDKDGKIIVRDPNSRINSEKTWDVEELIPQIKNLWSYQYNAL